MAPHVCPWWGSYFIDNPFRRLLHRPEAILAHYIQPGMAVKALREWLVGSRVVE